MGCGRLWNVRWSFINGTEDVTGTQAGFAQMSPIRTGNVCTPCNDPSVIRPNPATITDPLESSTKIRRRWGSFPTPVGPGPRPEDIGSAREKRLSRTPARAAERRRLTLWTGARPRGRALPARSSRDHWSGEKRGAFPPPSAPRGNRGCRDREESPKKKGVARRGAPWSKHLRKGGSLRLGGMSTRGPTLEAAERRWRRSEEIRSGRALGPGGTKVAGPGAV
ncbi:hypothetical protein NDU88_008273 [Pleurodeles waltl]|uniref:Uncharacterized protein n=1 Tax=Pleurodeles waltl TaxID=8319 RepID=A0AAV7QPF0_PLEWA|nr:hypothetical protein NDU88_008273 [Pleurodeles waltl]